MNDVEKVKSIKNKIEFFQATVGKKPDPPAFRPSARKITWDNWNKKSEPSPSQVELMISEATERKIQDIVDHFNLKDWDIKKTWGPGVVDYHFQGTQSVHTQINQFITTGRIGNYLVWGWPEYFTRGATTGDMKEAFTEDKTVGEQAAAEELEALKKEREEARLSMLEAFEKRQEQKKRMEALQARKLRAKRKAQYKIFQKRVDQLLDISHSGARLAKIQNFRIKFYEWYKPLASKLEKIVLMEQYDPTGYDWQMELNQDLPDYKDLYEAVWDAHNALEDAEETEKKRKKQEKKAKDKEEIEEAKEKAIEELNESGSKRIETLMGEYEDLHDKKEDMNELLFNSMLRGLKLRIEYTRKNIEETRRRFYQDSLKYLKDEYPDFWKIK